jgi:hypothetical protein
MKFTKIIGLTALTAVAAMALMGASSASATFSTQLCKNNLGDLITCTEPVTSVHAVAKNAMLLSPFVTVTCLESLVSATVLGLSKPQLAHLTSLIWTHCLTGDGSTCEVKTNKLGLFLILKTGANKADAQSHDTQVLVNCPNIGLHCIYGGLPTLEALGATLPTHAGTLHAKQLPLEEIEGGFFCPEETGWEALYESLTDIYIKS